MNKRSYRNSGQKEFTITLDIRIYAEDVDDALKKLDNILHGVKYYVGYIDGPKEGGVINKRSYRNLVAEESYEPTYLNGEGKYQKEYDMINDNLVPSQGFTDNIYVNAVIALSKIYYDYFNNGYANLQNADRSLWHRIEQIGITDWRPLTSWEDEPEPRVEDMKYLDDMADKVIKIAWDNLKDELKLRNNWDLQNE